jgi:hypothetical protein
MPPIEDDAAAGIALAKTMMPLLAGRGPFVQGAALADLVAMYLAGHAPELREEVLALHVAAVRKLVPVNAAMLRGEK